MKRFPGPPRSPVRRLPTVPAGMYKTVSSSLSLTTVQGHTVWTIRSFRSTERHTTLSPGANTFTGALLHFDCEHHEPRPQPAGGPRVAAPAPQIEACLGGRHRDR